MDKCRYFFYEAEEKAEQEQKELEDAKRELLKAQSTKKNMYSEIFFMGIGSHGFMAARRPGSVGPLAMMCRRFFTHERKLSDGGGTPDNPRCRESLLDRSRNRKIKLD